MNPKEINKETEKDTKNSSTKIMSSDLHVLVQYDDKIIMFSTSEYYSCCNLTLAYRINDLK